jgi:DNA-binding IclR family transcriptional regulator
MNTATDDQRYRVPGLERGLKLLQLFDRDRRALGPAEAARLLAVPRSSAFRLIQTLEQLGYLERSGSDYRLGPAIMRLGLEYVAAQPITETARPVLEQLRDDSGCTAHLAVRDGREVVYVLRIAGPSSFSSNVSVGTRLPLHATVLGRMFLAHLDEARVHDLYAGVTLERFTRHTVTSMSGLLSQAGDDRKRGYAVSESHFEGGISAIAAPVFDSRGDVVASVSISLLAPAIASGAERDRLVSAVRQAAADLSHRLNHRAAPARAHGASA